MSFAYRFTGPQACRCVQKAKPKGPKLSPLEREMKGRFRTVMVDEVWTPERVANMARALRLQHAVALTHAIPEYDASDPKAVQFWGDAHDSFEALYAKVIESSGKRAIASLAIGASFTLDNPYTVAAIREYTGDLITGLSQQARAVVQDLVGQAFTRHLPPEELADMIRPLLSLDERSAAAVMRRLDANMEAGMQSARATRLAEAAASDLLDARAETIARTEIITAEDRGRQAAWADAVDQGVLDPDAKRVWVAAMGSERTCPICEELDGQKVGLDEPFHSDYLDEDLDGPAAHPRCRCAVGLTT